MAIWIEMLGSGLQTLFVQFPQLEADLLDLSLVIVSDTGLSGIYKVAPRGRGQCTVQDLFSGAAVTSLPHLTVTVVTDHSVQSLLPLCHILCTH